MVWAVVELIGNSSVTGCQKKGFLSIEGEERSLAVKGKKLVPTCSNTRFICFLLVYLLFSDFLPVSSLLISRVFAILMCSLSHMPNKMDQSGLTKAEVTLDKMGAKCQGSILPTPAWPCCACLQRVRSVVGARWRECTAVCPWSVPY